MYRIGKESNFQEILFVARKSTLGESTILRGPLGSHKLTEIFRVAFFSDRTMYYMVTAVELDIKSARVTH